MTAASGKLPLSGPVNRDYEAASGSMPVSPLGRVYVYTLRSNIRYINTTSRTYVCYENIMLSKNLDPHRCLSLRYVGLQLSGDIEHTSLPGALDIPCYIEECVPAQTLNPSLYHGSWLVSQFQGHILIRVEYLCESSTQACHCTTAGSSPTLHM